MTKHQIIIRLIWLCCGVLAVTGFDPWGQQRGVVNSANYPEMVQAVGPVRVCEGRLWGGFFYAPYPSRPNTSMSALRRLQQRQELSNQQAAVIQLVQGNVEKAILQLQKGVEKEPSNAYLLSDLSAAYLESAEKAHNPSTLLPALAAADRAVSMDVKLPEARFNLALILEKLFLGSRAISEWQDYIALDPASLWAVEARKRIANLRKPDASTSWAILRPKLEKAALNLDQRTVDNLVSRFRQASRVYIEEEVLGRWAEAMRCKSYAKASQELLVARSVGVALSRITKDSMVKDTVYAIDRVMSSSNYKGKEGLVEAHRAFSQGVIFYQVQALENARSEFSRALGLFMLGHSPMASWARFYLAVCDYYALRYRRSFVDLSVLESSPKLIRYPALHGRVLWMMGLSHFARTNLNDSLEYFKRSLLFFEAMGEAENVAAVNFLLAENLHYKGERRVAWLHRYKAISLTREIIDKQRTANILYDFVDAALADGQLRVAKIFQDEQVKFALLEGRASSITEAYERRSKIFSMLGDYGGAMKDLARANSYLNVVKDRGIKERLRADILLSRAELDKILNPDSAIRELCDALTFFHSSGFELDEPQVLLSLAKIYEDRGNLDLAEKNLRAGVAWYRQKISQEGSQGGVGIVGGGASQAFRQLIQFEVRQSSKGPEAFELAEEARSRVVWDTVSASDLPPAKEALIRSIERRARNLSVREIQGGIPDDVSIIEYCELPEELIAWRIKRKEVRVFMIKIRQSDLAAEVGRFREDILTRSSTLARDAELLFSRLLMPLVGDVQNVGARAKLIIVPDGVLQELPFAALKEPTSGKFLIENFNLGIAPSAALYVSSLRASLPNSPRVLSVGASSFSRDRFPWLANLPDVEREARLVADGYSHSRLLIGPEVTRDSLSKSFAGSDVVHFAGHALVNYEFPLESRLLVSDGARRGSGEIFGFEFYGARLDGVKVVVLSACSSAGGEVQVFQGLSGLGRAMLVNGVPAVVGAQWAVTDSGGGQFWANFHRLLRSGKSPVIALSEVQREALSATDSWRQPRNWAAFQVIGDLSGNN